MKQRYGGDFDKFEKMKEACLRDGDIIRINYKGQSKKIQFTSAQLELRYTADKKSAKLKGVHLCKMVKRDIDDYLASGKKPPLILDKHYALNRYLVDHIDKKLASDNKRVASVDASAFYFTTGFKLGWISENTYKQVILHPEYKEGAVAAIGALNSSDYYEDFEAGQLVNSGWQQDKFYKYSPFYWWLIQTVYELMIKCAEKFYERMYMWITDCAFVDEEIAGEVEAFFKANGYRCKTKRGAFLKMDEDNIVHWKMDGSFPKSMRVYGHGFDGEIVLPNKILKVRKKKGYDEGDGSFSKRVDKQVKKLKSKKAQPVVKRKVVKAK